MSKRYTGGIVSATKPTTSGGETGSASGMWEIEQQGRLQAAGLWPIPYIPKYVEEVFSTYLYTGNANSVGNDVPNGIQFGGVPTNGTILHLTGDALSDSAPVPCPLTSTGVSVNTSTKKYGTGSLYYNGTGTNILTASSAALRFGTGDFTVECWVYNVSGGNQGIFHLGNDFGAGCVFVNMYPSGFFQWGWDGSYAGSVGSFPSSQWIHVALVRQSGVMKLYVNGTQVGSNNTFAGSINLGRIWVGNYYDTNYAWNGYIDDFRVSNKAVYTANFTPPAQALPLDTIVSGSNYGGMTWMKCRSTAYNGVIFDTLRGGTNTLRPATTDGNRTDGGSIAFNTSGWCVNTTNAGFNAMNDTYASWSFRRQPKFFDVVTFTTPASSNANFRVSHNLGAVPGCMIVKSTALVDEWRVWHRSFASAVNDYAVLNTSAAQTSYTNAWGSSGPTSTDFGVNTALFGLNQTYVAYVFAHNAGGFGLTGTDNVISCGTFTTDASGNATVNLGYEPQWILTKCTTFAKSWVLGDVMRGAPVTGQSRRLVPNTSAAEDDADVFKPTSTGFTVYETPSQSYIYIAIRRGPMRTPTSGTSVYYGLSRSGTSTNTTVSGSPFPVDLAIIKNRFNNDAFSSNSFVFDRVRGALNGLVANSADPASSAYTGSLTGFDVQNGYRLGNESSGWVNWAGSSGGATYMNWIFRRAPGFLDIVQYTGTGAVRTVAHALGAVPELIITKPLSGTGNWATYAAPVGPGAWLRLDGTNTPTSNTTTWNNTVPTATVFSLGTGAQANFNGYTFIAYLFASLPGVSKVGSYTGTAASLDIDCGFAGGARFVLIRRTDASGSWYVFDTTRGIVAGNEVYLMLNQPNRDTTADLIAPLSAGFQLTSSGSTTVNVNGGTYIYLAIA